MPVLWLVLIVFALATVGFFVGRMRALQSAGGDSRNLHSLPYFYGTNVALKVLVPALLVLGIWTLLQGVIINNVVSSGLPASAIPEGSTIGLVMSEVRRVAEGLDLLVAEGLMTQSQSENLRAEFTDVRARLAEVGIALGANVENSVLKAAQSYRSMTATGSVIMTLLVLCLAIAGAGFSIAQTHKNFRARNTVERGVLVLLIAAASLAILTTVGIVLSMVFETRNFFGLHSWTDFFFGSTWAPNFRGDSELSILPLLWGTLYISFVALLVAVPVGLKPIEQ